MLIFLVLSSLIGSCIGSEDNPTCTTADGEPGRCIKLPECEPLYKLIISENWKVNTETLRQSLCGFEGVTPKVCCPVDGTIPAGQTGLMKVDERCPPTRIPPAPESNCCGLQESTSYLLQDTTELVDHPWTALIEYRRASRFGMLCGGVLISSRHVLTAAHCVVGPVRKFGRAKSVRLGEYDIANEGMDCQTKDQDDILCNEGMISIPIIQIDWHVEFDSESGRGPHDIALIKMERNAPYSDFIRPICLPTRDVTKDPNEEHHYTVVGWGVEGRASGSNIKQEQNHVLVKEPETCQAANFTIGKEICGTASCKGDSGGALIFKDHQRAEVIGIISYRPKSCTDDHFTVYTNVFAYDTWIRENM